MEEKYTYWLSQIPHLRFQKMCEMYRIYGGAREIYEAGREKVLEAGDFYEKEKLSLETAWDSQDWIWQWEEMKRRSVRVVTYFHAEYPMSLKQLHRPPKCLYIKGELPQEKQLSIGVVGARNCTAYGRDMARMFGYRLAQQGVQIISGMARGVDGWSHQGALESGGKTYAVLGSGVEVCYPSSHKKLYQSIWKNGGILSEQPIMAEALPVYFPMRNRIISGLSQGLLVVEAREKSGSLITADAALEQGKDVFVIPGRIGDELSVGCNRLIRQGAIPVLSPQDILDYYGVERKKKEKELSNIEQQVLEYICVRPTHMDEVSNALQIPCSKLLRVLFQLTSKGEIEEVGRGYYTKKI